MTNEPRLADFRTPVVVEAEHALVRPGELLVDLAAESRLADRLRELNATGQPYRPGTDQWRDNPLGPPYGDLNQRLAPTGTRLWAGLPHPLLSALVAEIPGLAFNHVLVGEDFYHGGPGGPPEPVCPPPGGEPAAVPVAGPRIAVLDNGLAIGWDDWHPGLAGRLTKAPHPQLPESPLNEDANDILDEQAGHGLFISGLIDRVAPSLGIELHRVLHASGEGDESLIIAALEDVRNGTCPVVSLSLGAYTVDDRPPRLAGTVAALQAAGRVVVAAAGNAGIADRPFWPAALPGVVAVGAYRSPDLRWERSNPADVYSQGVDVLGDFVSWHPGEPGGFDRYARWSGTSFATPLVAATLALSGQDPNQWLAGLPELANWPAVPGRPGTPRLYVPPLDVSTWDAPS
jgi:Subtilase family